MQRIQRNSWLGLLGVFGIWITAGLALPFVNILKMFTPEQLMVFRGFLTAALALIIAKGRVSGAGRFTYWIAAVLPFATLGLYEGIRHWGAGPTIIVVTATPVVNFAIAKWQGRKLMAGAVEGLVLMLAGVFLARLGGTFQWAGLLWSIFGMIMNGILYELFDLAADVPTVKKCFWACFGMGVLGLVLSLKSSWAFDWNDTRLSFLVLGFAFVGGFLYWVANILAFKHLRTEVASVLAQGETPAVIIMASLLLSEPVRPIQWLGVAMALVGACLLIIKLAEKPPKQAENASAV